MNPIRPMLATLSPSIVEGPEWVFEEKYDGIRAVAARERVLREAGADLADVAEVRYVVEADEECAEVLAAAFRRGVSADHEFGLLAHLYFAPER